MNDTLKIFKTEAWGDYELLDTGDGEKLERFGQYILIRPYEDAFWKKTLPEHEWARAHGRFLTSKVVDSTRTKRMGEKPQSGWKFTSKLPRDWTMQCGDIAWAAHPTPFRHLQFFPEQRSHWEYIRESISHAGRPIKFLNLFGYTGVASLFALAAGAEVTHIDASKVSIDLAKGNQKLSDLDNKPMRVIVDDVIKFLEREVKRGNRYDAVIMDPPKFGRGPKGEIWKIEKDLPQLVSLVKSVLSSDPLFVILTSYALTSSALSLGYALDEIVAAHGGIVESGEMCITETSSGKNISLATTALWHTSPEILD
jgi:23S rRNA (cytosine1962-C5)-methyltransferase